MWTDKIMQVFRIDNRQTQATHRLAIRYALLMLGQTPHIQYDVYL